MPALPSISPSLVETILTLGLTIITAILAFGGSIWYFSLDRQTESFDEDLRERIEEDPSFSGIRESAETKYIATSANRTSKVVSSARKQLGKLADKPDKIIVVSSDDITQRRIEMIRERSREIKGRNLLSKDLVATLRNHYAYQLAVSEEDIDSEVVEHFQTAFEEYNHAKKVEQLSDPERYEEVILVNGEHPEDRPDILNDIFLPLVEAVEDYCINCLSDPTEIRKGINRCQQPLMVLFFGLWAQRAKGVRVTPSLSKEACIKAYREDIRDEDNWGYWMLPATKCDEEEFERLRHLAWSIDRLVDQYWEDEPHSILHPNADSIRDMEPVSTPFIVYQKEEQVFRGGGQAGS